MRFIDGFLLPSSSNNPTSAFAPVNERKPDVFDRVTNRAQVAPRTAGLRVARSELGIAAGTS